MGLLAIVFVFIPGLHFILVPGALVFAGWTFWKTLQVTRSIIATQAACSKCSEPFTLEGDLGGANLTRYCEKCGTLLHLELPEEFGSSAGGSKSQQK